MYKAMVYQKKRLQEGGTWLEIFCTVQIPQNIFTPKKGCVAIKQQYFLH